MSIQAYRVVPADSQQIPRARCYSGHLVTQPHMLSRTGLSPSTAGHSKPLPLAHMTGRLTVRPVEQDPTTPTTQPLTGITRNRFSQSSTFVRHYSRNHYCFLFLRVLRCFTSPCQPPHQLYIHWQVTTHHCGWVSPFGHPRINA